MTEDERRATIDATRRACLAAAEAAVEQAAFSGLCAEGRLDLVMDVLRSLTTDSLLARLDDPR